MIVAITHKLGMDITAIGGNRGQLCLRERWNVSWAGIFFSEPVEHEAVETHW